MVASDGAGAFRDALGTFATGITIVTTASADGQPVGVTASSFNSVSLDPPLVLWSLARSSHSHDVFCSSGHFAIHVLAADQQELSNRFARSGGEKFAGLELGEGLLSSPLLPDYAALFQCRTRHRYDGGDHVILVGEVVAYESRDRAPLLFHGGRYAETRAQLPATSPGATARFDPASFRNDFLSYLLARAHFLFQRAARPSLDAFGLSDADYAVLGRLSLSAPLDAAATLANLEGALDGIDGDHLGAMQARGLIEGMPDAIEATAQGKNAFLEVLSAGKAFEDHLAEEFDPDKLEDLKLLLREVIEQGGGGVPDSWRK